MKRVSKSEVFATPPAPEKKRKCLSLKKSSEAGSRFKLISSPMRKEAAKGVIPANTKLANEWFLRNLHSWIKFRSTAHPEEPVPANLLSLNDAEELCKWLCRYIQETRREDGTKYPPSTIRQLLAAFQRMLRVNKVSFNILDKSDIRFRDLHLTLDTVSVALRKEGVGASVKHARVISLEDETTLWRSKVLGPDSPESLLRAVFVIVGMHFCLRGGQEHRDLKVEQFQRFPDNHSYDDTVYYQYVENGSKNHQGLFSEVGGENKVVRAYAQPSSDRCPVRILDLYFSKLPPRPKAFYLQWLHKKPTDPEKPWYKVTPVGVNPLKNMMSKICELAGLTTKYTNHSLRATAATRMFSSGLPEKVIAEVTGHKSSKGLRQYERTSKEQEQAAGKAIAQLAMPAPCSSGAQVDTKPSIEALKKETAKAVAEKVMPTVSGTLSGCVFNFNF